MTKIKAQLNWIETEIGNISDVVAGGTPKAADLSNFTEPGSCVAWLTPADLSKYNKKYISHGKRDLSEKGLNSSSAKLMPKGSVLFSSRAPIGYVVVASNEISTNQGFKNFVFTKHVDSTYAYYYLRSIRGLAEERGSGTTFKELSGANAKKLPFVLPPLAEQKQIAIKLDELLAQVDTIKNRLDAIPNILKRFRQSVLAAAVSGKLTKEWRLNNVGYISNKSCLNNIGLITGGKTPSKSNPDYWKLGTIPWVSPKDMKVDEIKTSKNLITELAITKGGMKFVPVDSVLMVTRSGILAHTFPVAITKSKVTINQDIKAFIPDVSVVSARFVFLLLKGLSQKILFECSKTGTTVPSVGTELLTNLEFTLPSLEEQKEIVSQVEQLLTFSSRIEKQVMEAQARVNNLTQSILAKSFRGELTTEWREQNSNLITGENSAEALLEKIKIERQKILNSKKNKNMIKSNKSKA